MITRETLKELAEVRDTCISLYTPMEQAGKDTRKNRIRFKNRVQEAEKQLEDAGFSETEAKVLLADAYKLVDDNDFWQHQSSGLAVFINSEGMQRFKAPIELPELTVVGTRYHLKPLMTLLKNDGRYFVLALSLKEANLYEASRYTMTKLDLEELDNVPTSLKEALKFEVYQKQLGHYTASGAGASTFHGQGSGKDDRKQRILYYFRQLENGVSEFLAAEQAPLVFAGVDYLFPIYQEANHYPYLIDEAVIGNPDEWDANELRERSWPLVEAYFSRHQKEAFATFQQLAGTEQATTKLTESLLAAHDGRVDTVFVPVGQQIWGRFDTKARKVTESVTPENSEDLLNLLAIFTLTHGGKVFTLAPEAMPDSSTVATIYRY